MKFNYTSFEDTLSFAESLGWTEPETDVYDHNVADALEFEALTFIESHGYIIEQ